MAFTIVFAFPLFWLLDMKTRAIVILAVMVALNFGHGLMFAPEFDLFSRAVRRAGALQRRLVRLPGFGRDRRRLRADHRDRAGRLYGRHRGVSVMLILLALITLAATLFARETKDEALLK